MPTPCETNLAPRWIRQQNKFNSAKSGFQVSAKDRIASMSKSANEVINQPFPQFGGGSTTKPSDNGVSDLQSKIAEGRREIEALRQQVAAAKLQKAAPGINNLQPMTPSATMSAPKQLGGNSLQPMARQPLANSNLNNSLQPMASNTVAKPGNLSPLDRIASNAPTNSSMNASSGSFSPGGALSRLQPIAGSGGFKAPSNAGSVSNSTGAAGSNSLAPMTNKSESTVYGSLSPKAAPAAGSGTKSAYPSTPHNGFSGQKVSAQDRNDLKIRMPESSAAMINPIAPVGFESSDNGGNRVTHAGALMPIGSNGVNSASRIGNHASNQGGVSSVSDVALPAALLKGNGSYSPGSVNSIKTIGTLVGV